MDLLARRVLRTARRRGLLAPTDRVAVAISGGSDSVALAWVLADLEAEQQVVIAGLTHVNHQLRGDESESDERFCRALAARLGWPIEVSRIDVPARARERSQSIEAAARDLRYQSFEEAAGRLGATVVATGHTLDDQAETVLLRMLRGAALRGLAGIRARRGRYVRPLLESRREELLRYLQRCGETFREDSSNKDLAIPRNRIRHELMPVLARLAPGSVRSLARLAALAADDEAYLTRAAIEIQPAVVLSKRGERCEIDVEAFNRLPPALGRRLIRELSAEIAPGRALAARHLDAVRDLSFADKTDGHLDLPGLKVCLRGERLVLAAAGETDSNADAGRQIALERPLDVPGTAELPEIGVRITATVGQTAFGMAVGEASTTVAVLQAASIVPPLVVRGRRPGDRIRPLGAPGRRKLQDVLVDRKVPRAERDRVPLVVDASGRIVWVAGVAIADECRVTAPEGGMVILEMRKAQ